MNSFRRSGSFEIPGAGASAQGIPLFFFEMDGVNPIDEQAAEWLADRALQQGHDFSRADDVIR